MAQNKILPWAQTSTANTLSDADYASAIAPNGAYADGVKSGQASSHQANKTWRQATAPGSGLGQFLVDNLNVDVTDADTPATFSSRIANAILKLAQISPFNQSFAAATGGYRKYAIVSDASGNYWSSTADQNVTVPGTSGAKWQSLFDGYLTQSVAASTYVKKSGDISTGTQYNSGWFWGGYNAGFGGGTATGALRWTNFGVAFGNPLGLSASTQTFSGNICVSDVIGNANDNSSGINMRGYDFQGTLYNWFFAWNGNITTPKGIVAFQSDVVAESSSRIAADDNLQNQINGKQPAGNYVTADAYSSDFSTSDSRVINLAYGHKLQGFVVTVEGSGVHDIAFPQSFSGVPTTIVISNGLTNGSNSPVSVLGGWTVTGFQIQTNGSTSVNFLAMGPK